MADHFLEDVDADLEVVFGGPIVLPPLRICCNALNLPLGCRSTLGDGRKHAARSDRSRNTQGGPVRIQGARSTSGSPAT
eukprot:12930173-Alexandrium_andersonii.AAC.1